MDEPASWSQRYKQNVALLRSGEELNVALVVERLLRRRREEQLSNGERWLLRRAVQTLDEMWVHLPLDLVPEPQRPWYDVQGCS